jgi:hypothetical protein
VNDDLKTWSNAALINIARRHIAGDCAWTDDEVIEALADRLESKRKAPGEGG